MCWVVSGDVGGWVTVDRDNGGEHHQHSCRRLSPPSLSSSLPPFPQRLSTLVHLPSLGIPLLTGSADADIMGTWQDFDVSAQEKMQLVQRARATFTFPFPFRLPFPTRPLLVLLKMELTPAAIRKLLPAEADDPPLAAVCPHRRTAC